MEPKVTFNPRLFWDYDVKEEDLAREDVLILYISKVLNNGTLADVQGVPEALIRQYLNRLHLSSRVRKFWEWHLGLRTPKVTIAKA